MKKGFFSLLLLLVSCSVEFSSNRYVSFVVNTQEFIYVDESIETLNRILDIHETYSVPVDVYLTDSVLKAYEESAPELVERLKTSEVVAISYHYRPPYPYHSNAYDFYGLADMSTDELYELLLDYENHGADLESGEPDEGSGGYQYVKDTMGYAPVVVGMAVDSRKVGDVLGQVYKEKGASFAVSHEASLDLGEERFELLVRPEHIEVKLFEQVGEEAEALISGLWNERAETSAPEFMNIKVHDNDFIADKSAWLSIYLRQKPPYHLERGTAERELLSEEKSEALWSLYEASVKYVSEHPELYSAINAFDLQAF